MGRHGAEALLAAAQARGRAPSGRLRVLTHCNTGSLATAAYGTALGVIRALHEAGQLEHAYCCETRPYNQARAAQAALGGRQRLGAGRVGCSASLVGCEGVAANAGATLEQAASAHRAASLCTPRHTQPKQGARLTAYELVHDGLPATLICDSAAAALMAEGKVDAVVVGADRIAANGDTGGWVGGRP